MSLCLCLFCKRPWTTLCELSFVIIINCIARCRQREIRSDNLRAHLPELSVSPQLIAPHSISFVIVMFTFSPFASVHCFHIFIVSLKSFRSFIKEASMLNLPVQFDPIRPSQLWSVKCSENWTLMQSTVTSWAYSELSPILFVPSHHWFDQHFFHFQLSHYSFHYLIIGQRWRPMLARWLGHWS